MAFPAHYLASDTSRSLEGCYRASPVKYMVYGRGKSKDLTSIIRDLGGSRAYVLTGKSLNDKTPVIRDIEAHLGAIHIGTHSGIRQHAPIRDITLAATLVGNNDADILISVGGGSPIDATKAVAHIIHQNTGRWLPHIAIPTTLSVAETGQNAGYTNEHGHKVTITHPEMVPKAVVYDGDITIYTPTELWTSTGMRALDHAIELLYHPLAPEYPTKRLCLSAIHDLFGYLPLSQQNPHDGDIRQALQLAAYGALFPSHYPGGVGLSHSIGHAIGASYGIPHGLTSCISLAAVVRCKAGAKKDEARQIARALPCIGKTSTADVTRDARMVADAIDGLVQSLGLRRTLSMYNVPPEDEDAIVTRALKGKDGSERVIVKEIVHSLY